jgi:O-antigen/teichoic acid export membrane protein
MSDTQTCPTLGGHGSNPVVARLNTLLRSAGMRHSLIIGSAMILAGALDYAVNVVAGRWLDPVEYGTFISVTAILQVLLLLAIAIRMMVAFHTAELSAQSDSPGRIGGLVRSVWKWAWQWGLLATALMALASPVLKRMLHLPDAWPLLAASLMVLFLFLRESTYGALQGIQQFTGLGVVQVIQSSFRLILAAVLIWIGWRATGAILAQPLGCVFALVVAICWLRPQFKAPESAVPSVVNWRYSACTLVGLAAFGVLTNLDALFVKHFFGPQVAGNYGPVVTLAKVCLFLPWALGMLLLPKVIQRRASGRDARPLLLLALAAALAPSLALSALYFISPGILVKFIFTGAYADPGVVLGLASFAASLYAGLYIWLNYALSIHQPAFAYVLVAVLCWQGVGMFIFGRGNLVHMTMVMVSAGLIGNIAGFVAMWSVSPAGNPIHYEIAQ